MSKTSICHHVLFSFSEGFERSRRLLDQLYFILFTDESRDFASGYLPLPTFDTLKLAFASKMMS